MAKENKGEYKEFRSLLRRGIGTRTQRAFAEEVNISKEHLNRMLNNREIYRPTEAVLKRMAAHMKTVTERMLLESCGYGITPIKDRAELCEKQINECLADLTGTEQPRLWKSPEDAVQTAIMNHLDEIGELVFGEEEPCTGSGHRWAEKKLHFEYRWGDEENACITGADIYYFRTENGNIFFQDYAVADTEILKKARKGSTEMEERLLKAIFGDDDEEKVMTTAFGYGFYYPETPAGFADFICAHRGEFCNSRERSHRVLSMIDGNADPDAVFKDFETDKYGSGTGGAVAEILSKKTGMYFYYYQDSVNEKCSTPCIMTEDEEFVRSGMNKTQLLLILHDAAASLQVPQFGHIYYSYPASTQLKLYDTKTFGYEFRDAD